MLFLCGVVLVVYTIYAMRCQRSAKVHSFSLFIIFRTGPLVLSLKGTRHDMIHRSEIEISYIIVFAMKRNYAPFHLVSGERASPCARLEARFRKELRVWLWLSRSFHLPRVFCAYYHFRVNVFH